MLFQTTATHLTVNVKKVISDKMASVLNALSKKVYLTVQISGVAAVLFFLKSTAH